MVLWLANTSDISTAVIKVCAIGWRGLLTFMVINRVAGNALYVFDLISRRGVDYTLPFWSGRVRQWGGRGLLADRETRVAFEVEGGEQKNDILPVTRQKKGHLQFRAIADGTNKVYQGARMTWLKGGRLTTCPTRLQGATRHRAPFPPPLRGNCILTPTRRTDWKRKSWFPWTISFNRMTRVSLGTF